MLKRDRFHTPLSEPKHHFAKLFPAGVNDLMRQRDRATGLSFIYSSDLALFLHFCEIDLADIRARVKSAMK